MRIKIVIGLCACLVVALYFWKANFSYEGEVGRFRENAKSKLRPAEIQEWAMGLLQKYGTNPPTAEYESHRILETPDYLQRIWRTSPVAVAFITGSADRSFVKLTWGSGGRGHWGLIIGQTNFNNPYGSKGFWTNGIYFWNE